MDAFCPFNNKDDFNKYVINPKNIFSPYMTIGFHSTAVARNHLVAALHPSDLTLRPQLVTKRDNTDYYQFNGFQK